MSLVLGVLFFGACLSGHAQPLEVNVINSAYTASLSWWGMGGFLGNPDVSGSNSAGSAAPASINYVNQGPSIITGPNYTTVWGQADAGLFQSQTFCNTGQGQYFNCGCLASATSDVSFSAFSSQTANLSLEFTGFDNYGYSDCLVSLNDVTSGQALWAYGWRSATGTAPPYTIPYVDVYQNLYPSGSITVAVPTAFVGGDTYELVMDTDANSNNDAEGVQIQLSGLGVAMPIYFVPEPSTFAFLGLVAMLLMLRRGLRWNLRD